MAGVTAEGFVLKRLSELLAERRQLAVELFQDLVLPGEVVDTSDSSTLGRLIGLAAPSEADLWEALQQVYSAFDVNSATGIALDNIVAIGGIVREGDSYSTVPAIFRGQNNTLIPVGSVVTDESTGEQWETRTAVSLLRTAASGISVTVGTVADSTPYEITFATSSTTGSISYTSGTGATTSSILNGIKAVVDASFPPTFTATIQNNTLIVDRVDPYQTTSFSVTSNLNIVEVSTVSELVAADVGPIEALVGNINTITTPILGWNSVSNISSASAGTFRETDEELRVRFRNSKFIRATNSLDSIFSAISSVDSVEEVKIYENDTDVTDANGVPPHSFLPIVVGGISTSIANAIWENKPIGILSYGNTTVTIFDVQGFPHDVSFSRPTPVDIYIDIDISTTSDFPATGADQIKQALIEYSESNFGIGDDVIYSRLYTPINSIAGHQVNSLTIGTSPSPTGTSNLALSFDEIASLNAANINITIS